ncbi:hypothetical protein BX600DRAFT_473907 [Xylariales sp. PMI_506]|nr:hypothetical protein BX600DRAFT_473907 [Xylariales sp. PMI_506]
MVGIPGRSKACLTCLTRRKGCGARRPVCQQCERLGIECTWRELQTVFVNTTVPKNRGNKSGQLTRINATPFSAGGFVSVPITWAGSSPLRLTIPILFQDVFLPNYLPMDAIASANIPKSSVAGWLTVADKIDVRSDHLKLSLAAVSACMLGVQNRDKQATSSGWEFYGKALTHLAKSFSHLSVHQRLVAIITCRFLALFEIFCAGDNEQDAVKLSPWTFHNTGELSLILGTNPTIYQQGAAHRIFTDGRSHLVAINIMNRKASILGQQGWKTTPWEKISKSPKDMLLDVMVDIPEILELSDILWANRSQQYSSDMLQYLKSRHALLKAKLTDWYRVSGLRIEAVLQNVAAYDASDVTISDLGQLHHLLLYWCCLLFCSEVHTAIFNLEQPLTDPGNLFPLWDDGLVIYRSLLRALPLFLNGYSGWFGLHLATLPMVVMYRYVRIVGIQHRLTTFDLENLDGLFQTPKGRVLQAFASKIHATLCQPVQLFEPKG